METNFTTKPIKKGLLAKAKPYFGVTVLVLLVVFAIVTSVTNYQAPLDQQIAERKAGYEAQAAELKAWKSDIEIRTYYQEIKLCLDQKQIQILEIGRMFETKESNDKIKEKLNSEWSCF